MAAHALAFIAYLVLTVTMTWPLAIRLGDLVPHDLGDPLLSTTILWWNAQVVPFTARWWDGFFFFPAPATLTLSDHRVGLGLIASPLIWSGASALTAHNVTFLASYVLSAMAGYALAFVLTRSGLAAFVGGLIFGFNPFRAEHLPHLELLASYWLPIVPLALHRWVDTRRVRWLLVLAASLTLQAITCGYYFFFAGVLIGLWLLWFVPRDASLREYAGLALALATPLILIAPILLVYRAAHTDMALVRSIDEIEQLSADLLGLITPPDPLWLWNTPQSWQRPEGSILVGVTAMVMVALGALRPGGAQALPDTPRWLTRLRTAGLAVVLAAIVMATLPAFVGPVGIDLGVIRLSSSGSYKPLSVATVFFGVWFMTSRRMRAAARARSPLAFYALATVAMWLFALGPTARFMGERVLYKAPYSWLMLMPGFRDEFRAPARFAMLAALTVSAAAAVALWRLVAARPPAARAAAAAVISAAILVESWVAPFELVAAPAPLEIPSAVPAGAVVLELPIDVFEDARAMFHATTHGRPIVNGLSGYDPPHYAVVRAAMRDKIVEVLPPLAVERDLAIFVARDQAGAELVPLLHSRIAVERLASTATHEVLLLRRRAEDQPPATRITAAVPIRGLSSPLYPDDLPLMLDDNRFSAWSSQKPQAGGEQLTVDLGEIVDLHAVRMSLGAHRTGFPRLLVVETSSDGATWAEAWRGGTAAQALIGALADPPDVPIWLPLPETRARYLRFRQLSQSDSGWVIAKLEVFGSLLQ